MRQLFGFGRKVLNGLTQSMGPEITRVYGAGDWKSLSRLYNYSERFIFALIAVINFGLLYSSPILLVLWQGSKAPGLFVLWPYLLITAINTVLCVKEHKYQFQVATNVHIELARVMSGGYVALGLISLVTIHYAGLAGFLWAWLAVEICQTIMTVRLNLELFASVERLTLKYLLRLAVLGSAGLVAGFFLLQHATHWSYRLQVGGDMVTLLAVGLAAYFLFQMHDIAAEINRLMVRFKRA